MTQHKKHRTLTGLLRDEMPPELFLEWYSMIAEGKNPKLVRDMRSRTTTNGWKVIEDELDREPPTKTERSYAMKVLLERRDGQAAQMQVIEQQLRISGTAGALTVPQVIGLDPAAIAAAVGALRGVLAPPASSAPTLPVGTSSQDHSPNVPNAGESSAIADESGIIDAESTDMPNPDLS